MDQLVQFQEPVAYLGANPMQSSYFKTSTEQRSNALRKVKSLKRGLSPQDPAQSQSHQYIKDFSRSPDTSMRGERCYISSKITNKLEELGSREALNAWSRFNH